MAVKNYRKLNENFQTPCKKRFLTLDYDNLWENKVYFVHINSLGGLEPGEGGGGVDLRWFMAVFSVNSVNLSP